MIVVLLVVFPAMSELLFECYHVPSVAYGIDSLFSLHNNFTNSGTKTNFRSKMCLSYKNSLKSTPFISNHYMIYPKLNSPLLPHTFVIKLLERNYCVV